MNNKQLVEQAGSRKGFCNGRSHSGPESNS